MQEFLKENYQKNLSSKPTRLITTSYLLDTMIYLSQFIFIKKGKEATFLQFEAFAIPLMEAYNGRILYRIRPNKESLITTIGELPYEIHFISFDSEADFERFMQDERRLEFLHLKEESIESTLLIKGKKM